TGTPLPSAVEAIGGPFRERTLALLGRAAGIDFSCYEWDWLLPRIAQHSGAWKGELGESWLNYLDTHPVELRDLAGKVLAAPAAFFRAPLEFDEFRGSILPALLDSFTARADARRDPFRVWISGCVTGQEVYSVAICLAEAMGERGAIPAQVFGTDVNES